MKISLQPRPRISRTFIPSATIDQPVQRSSHIKYFSKIIGNIQLLQKYDLDHKFKNKNQHNSFYGKRFNLSKRLQQLSRIKIAKKQNQTQRNTIEIQHRRNRINSQRNTVSNRRDENYDLQIANINKTINGTQLGALSSLQIMDELQALEQQKKHRSFYGFDKLVKRMDSDFLEESVVKTKKHYNRKHSMIEGTNFIEKQIEVIYEGGQGFLDKYRQYQINLLEKIPSCTSKPFTFDCKNQWRI